MREKSAAAMPVRLARLRKDESESQPAILRKRLSVKGASNGHSSSSFALDANQPERNSLLDRDRIYAWLQNRAGPVCHDRQLKGPSIKLLCT